MERKRGRPMTANHVQVVPEFRPEPDIEKLGRALLAIAISSADRQKNTNEGDMTSSATHGEGDGMT